MRLPPMLEPQARGAARTSWRCAAGRRSPDDDFLAFFELASEDFGEVAVGNAELEADGRRLAARVQDENAPRHRALPRELGVGQLRVVLGTLLCREDGADLAARGLADALSFDPALAVAETARRERPHLLARVLEDGLELLLLLGCQRERFD